MGTIPMTVTIERAGAYLDQYKFLLQRRLLRLADECEYEATHVPDIPERPRLQAMAIARAAAYRQAARMAGWQGGATEGAAVFCEFCAPDPRVACCVCGKEGERR